MSADDPAGGDENSDEDSLPRVPSIEDPRHETPLTEDFETGTANDPPLPSEFDDGDRIETAEGSLVTLTVDGESVAVREGATVLDALRAAGVDGDVPALCSYDRDTEAAVEPQPPVYGVWRERRLRTAGGGHRRGRPPPAVRRVRRPRCLRTHRRHLECHPDRPQQVHPL
jgi:hypothetical protein